jgi:hypothetical protein
MRSEAECMKLKFSSPAECARVSRAPQPPLTLTQFEEDVRQLGKAVTGPDETEPALVGAFGPNSDIDRPWYLVQTNGNLLD